MTNFSIYMMKSRLIGSRRAISECEEPGVRRGAEGTLECPVDVDTRAKAGVGPWQYQS